MVDQRRPKGFGEGLRSLGDGMAVVHFDTGEIEGVCHLCFTIS